MGRNGSETWGLEEISLCSVKARGHVGSPSPSLSCPCTREEVFSLDRSKLRVEHTWAAGLYIVCPVPSPYPGKLGWNCHVSPVPTTRCPVGKEQPCSSPQATGYGGGWWRTGKQEERTEEHLPSHRLCSHVSQWVWFDVPCFWKIDLDSLRENIVNHTFCLILSFCIEAQLTYNVMFILGIQPSASIIHIHTYMEIYIQIIFHCRLLKKIESNRMCDLQYFL